MASILNKIKNNLVTINFNCIFILFVIFIVIPVNLIDARKFMLTSTIPPSTVLGNSNGNQQPTSTLSKSTVTTTQTIDNQSDFMEIIIGDRIHLKERVPVNTKLIIKCTLDTPIYWYKNDEKLHLLDITSAAAIRKRQNTIKFEKIKRNDAGLYSCRSTVTNEWSNLTLVVTGTNNRESHIGSTSNDDRINLPANMQIYSQISDYNNGAAVPIIITTTQQTVTTNHHDDTHNYEENDDYPEKDVGEQVDTPIHYEEQDEGSPPNFKQAITSTIAKPSGSYIRLACPSTGQPLPNITWTKDDKTIVRTMGKVTIKKWAIIMEDVIPEDSGHYKCKVCNLYGCIEHIIKVIISERVNHKPIMTIPPQNLTLIVNESGEMTCKILSDLHHSIGWTFQYCNLSYCTPQKNATVIKADPESSDILRLTEVTHDDEGWYTCIAANSLGTSTASAYLRVVDEFDEPKIYPIRNHSLWISIVTLAIGLLFLLGTLFILFILRKLKHEKLMKHRMETVHQWTKKVVIYKPSTDPCNPETMVMPIIKIEKQRTTLLQNSNTDPVPFNEYEFPLDSNWEIPRSQLTLGATLGEGAFGRVVMGEVIGLNKHLIGVGGGCGATNSNGSCIVAVKMVKEGHTDADMASLVREMEVMKMIGKHINIINLLGCCSQDGPLYVIVEYAPYGNLKDFLKKNRPTSTELFDNMHNSTMTTITTTTTTTMMTSSLLNNKFDNNIDHNHDKDQRKSLTQKDLISFAFQVARGMEYLASRRCIHRDLAARNVLVSDDYVIKIADFGLARDIQDTDYYRKNTNGRLPIKWMAPESLQDKFYDTQSDVWSYGVLLWEIMTFGEQPYPQIMSAEELYNYLMSGQRMEKPPRCSLNIYMLMRQCWNFDALSRPTFSEIVENLDRILTATANANEEYLDLGVPLIETPPSSDDDDNDDHLDDESDTDTLKETALLRRHY